MSSVVIIHGSNDVYGASRVLLDEACALQTLGHSVAVVLPTEGPLTKKLSDMGVQVHIEPSMSVLRKSALQDSLRSPWLPKAARKADVVVLWTLAVAHYSIALRLSRRRFYVAVHELLPGRLGTTLVNALVRSGSFDVTSCSGAVKSWLISCGVDAERIRVTYPVIDFAEEATELPQLSTSDTVAVVARVNGHKGHEAVARAFIRVAPPEAKLILAGSPYPGQEHHLTSLMSVVSTDPRLQYTGEIGNLSDLPSDVGLVACFPSRPEPFGLVPIEAATRGILSMGFADGGAAEALALVGGIAVERSVDDETAIGSALDSWFQAEPGTRPRPSLLKAKAELTLAKRADTLSKLDVWTDRGDET